MSQKEEFLSVFSFFQYALVGGSVFRILPMIEKPDQIIGRRTGSWPTLQILWSIKSGEPEGF